MIASDSKLQYLQPDQSTDRALIFLNTGTYTQLRSSTTRERNEINLIPAATLLDTNRPRDRDKGSEQ